MARKFLDLTGFQYFITKVIGKKDISSIGDGTVKGAIGELNENLNNSYLPCNNRNAKTPIDVSGYVGKYNFLTGALEYTDNICSHIVPFMLNINDIDIIGRKIEIYGNNQFRFSVTDKYTVIVETFILNNSDVSASSNVYYRLIR